MFRTRCQKKEGQEKRRNKSKKDRSQSHGSDKATATTQGLEEDERKELRELRHQAEIRRVRDEVLAEAAAKPRKPDKQAVSPKTRKIGRVPRAHW